MSHGTFPPEFTDLEPLVESWAFRTERERRHACAAKQMPEIQDYYARVGPRLEAIAAHLDGFPMGVLPEPQAQLFMLAQMYMEVAICVEFLKGPEMGPLQITQDRWHILGA